MVGNRAAVGAPGCVFMEEPKKLGLRGKHKVFICFHFTETNLILM